MVFVPLAIINQRVLPLVLKDQIAIKGVMEVILHTHSLSFPSTIEVYVEEQIMSDNIDLVFFSPSMIQYFSIQ